MHSGALAARRLGSPFHLMNIDVWLSEQDPASCQEALDGNLSCLNVSVAVAGSTGGHSVCCHLLFQRPTGSEICLDRTAGFAAWTTSVPRTVSWGSIGTLLE